MFGDRPVSDVNDPSRERRERHGRILTELADIGMNLARALERRAVALAEAAEAADTPVAGAAEAAREDAGVMALAFSRVAKAVRQTLALEARLADRAAPPGLGPADPAAIEAEARARRRAGGDISRLAAADILERSIEAETEGAETERLLADLYERLRDDQDMEVFADRSVGEIVNAVRHDLGLPPDDTDWEAECEAEAADAFGSPALASLWPGAARGRWPP